MSQLVLTSFSPHPRIDILDQTPIGSHLQLNVRRAHLQNGCLECIPDPMVDVVLIHVVQLVVSQIPSPDDDSQVSRSTNTT